MNVKPPPDFVQRIAARDIMEAIKIVRIHRLETAQTVLLRALVPLVFSEMTPSEWCPTTLV
jgi:hypothetical protein